MVYPDGDKPMKNFTPNQGQNTSDTVDSAAAFARQSTSVMQATVRRISFWSAILLPLVYLPLLAGGLSSQTALIVVGLFALNLTALFVGHNHTHN